MPRVSSSGDPAAAASRDGGARTVSMPMAPASSQGLSPTLGSEPQQVPRLMDGMTWPEFSLIVLPVGVTGGAASGAESASVAPAATKRVRS